jgi:hypothetical protein
VVQPFSPECGTGTKNVREFSLGPAPIHDEVRGGYGLEYRYAEGAPCMRGCAGFKLTSISNDDADGGGHAEV